MKILLVTQTYLDSYPPRNLSMASAVKQSTQLSKKHQVLVLTCGRTVGDDNPNPNLRILSVPGLLIPDPVNYVFCPLLLTGFIDQVKKFKPDIVLVSKFMFFSSLVIPLGKLMGQKVITTTDTFPGINWFPRSKIVSVIMWLYARIIGLPLLWMSDRVILLYSGLKPVADRYGLKSLVIPNGVEDSLLGELPLPKDLKKGKGKFWVGFVGRSESVKGYDIALQTADELIEHPDIEFIFIGGNQKQYNASNKKFLGFRKDVYNIYQLLDVLILPSISEGLPNVVMEAMAQHVVVVANPVGGVKDLVQHNETGILVSKNTASEFAAGIIKLHKDSKLKEKLGDNARNIIGKNFSWSKIIGLYENIS